MSKTKEEILFDHCPIYNPLFADEQTKRFREETLKAMDAYAAQQVEEYKERLKMKVDKQKNLLVVTREIFKTIINEA